MCCRQRQDYRLPREKERAPATAGYYVVNGHKVDAFIARPFSGSTFPGMLLLRLTADTARRTLCLPTGLPVTHRVGFRFMPLVQGIITLSCLTPSYGAKSRGKHHGDWCGLCHSLTAASQNSLREMADNIEFSCPAASTQNYLELPSRIHRSTRPHRGQLQRQVMNTIRVMARPERADLTAHATKASHCKSLRCQAASRGASPTASIQFRRTLPAPSPRTA
jgi:hypothetical protein